MRQTRETILQSAAILMEERGASLVSMDDVAVAAKLTKRTVYNHFQSKDVLIAAWLSRRSELTSSSDPATDVDPIDAIVGLFEALRDHIVAGPFRGCPFVLTSAETFGAPHLAQPVAQRHKIGRLKWFERQLRLLEVCDPEPAAEELMVAWEGAWASSLVLVSSAPAEAAVRLAGAIVERAVSMGTKG